VWTGSHNWSDVANVSNDENSIVIHNAPISNLYYQEFKKRFDLAIPISEHPVLDLGPDQNIFGGDTIQLDAGQFVSYVWSTGDLTQIISVDSSGVGFGTKKIYCRVSDAYGIQSDTVRITFKPHTSIGEQNALVSNLTVYPNPSDGNFTVSVRAKENQPASLELTSLDGKALATQNVILKTGSNAISMNELRLASGFYLLRLKTKAGNLSTRVLIY